MDEIEGRVETAGTGAWHEVATPQGRRLKTRFVIPGERVRLTTRADDPGFADLAEVLEPSPHRRKAPCSFFGACGGCQLQHVSSEWQLEQHAERARAVLRATGFPRAAELLRSVAVPSALAYRSRARFQVGRSAEGAWQLGFHETAGRRTLDVPDCPLLSPELEQAWRSLRPALIAADPRGLTGLELTALPGSNAVLLNLNPRDHAPEPWPGLGERLLAEGLASGVAVRLGRSDPRPARLGERAALGRTPAGRPVAAALGGFVQANLGGADRLCDEVLRMAEPRGLRVLELHAGAGLLSHALAEAGAHVQAYDLDAESVAAGARLPPPAQGALTIAVGDAASAFAERASESDLLVTDPPRSGLGELAAAIADEGPARLVGVWCSLDGLERDLRALAGAYRPTAASVIALFPQTRHCEVVALLER